METIVMTSQVSHSSKVNTKFAVEINTSTSIPFDFSNQKKKSERKITRFTYIDHNRESFVTTQTEVIAPEGFPGKAANDIWIVLMTKAEMLLKDPQQLRLAEARGFVRIHFTQTEIANRLGKDENYLKSVAVGLRQLDSVKVHFSNMITGLKEFKTDKISVGLFMKYNSSKKGFHGDRKKLSEETFVDIDFKIVSMFVNGVFAQIETREYLKLPTGAPRKLIQILEGQRRVVGPKFLIDMEQLANILCLNWPGRANEQVRGYMSSISRISPEIVWEMKKIEGQIYLYVDWQSATLENTEVNPFAKHCFEIYGEDKLMKLKIDELYQIEALVNKLPTNEVVKVGRTNYSKAEVCVDVMLYQILELDNLTIPTHLGAYVKNMYENLEIPPLYKYVGERVKKKNDVTLKEQMNNIRVQSQFEQEIAIQEKYKMMGTIIDSLRDRKPTEYNNLEQLAKSVVELEGNPMSNLLVRDAMIRIATERMESPDYDGSFV